MRVFIRRYSGIVYRLIVHLFWSDLSRRLTKLAVTHKINEILKNPFKDIFLNV